jgi:hypothetical protein
VVGVVVEVFFEWVADVRDLLPRLVALPTGRFSDLVAVVVLAVSEVVAVVVEYITEMVAVVV